MTVPSLGRDDENIASGVARPVARPLGRGDAPSAGVKARPWASGSVDVEDLATWAFRDQMVERFASDGLHAIERDLVGLEPHGSSTDGCAALARIAHLGGRIDRGSARLRDLVHPAAEVVAAALHQIDGGRLVAFHARTGSRPEGWSLPKRRFRPVMWVRPGVEAAWERADDGRSRYTPLIVLGSPEGIAARRRDYVLWWSALDLLSWRLSMKAIGFTVRPPAAPREPWADLLAEQGK